MKKHRAAISTGIKKIGMNGSAVTASAMTAMALATAVYVIFLVCFIDLMVYV